MDEFVFKWKRRFFWKRLTVTGFIYSKDLDRMTLFLKNGSLFEIAKWNKHDCFLGEDYHRIIHKKMEKEAGQAIPLNNRKVRS